MTEQRNRLRDRCAIVGVGYSRLGQVPELSSSDLLLQAIKNVLDDAGLDIRDVDGLICRGPHDVEPQRVRCGMHVVVKFEDRSPEISVPKFLPAEAQI
jgi:hypothetical protein